MTATPALCLGFALLAATAFAQERPTPPAAAAKATVESPAGTPGQGTLRFNFRGAPLETVLNYMSEAAGYVIVLETPLRGTIDMWSAQPVSRTEAVQLLNLALNKNGYTASVQGRNLIVSSKDDAKKRNIPIRTGNDPREIPETAEMVMQIIPMRHIDAAQAAQDLAPLLPASTTVTSNQDSNSLIVTDTQINVRHIVTLVAALDTSSDGASTMRVFKLHNADPIEMASLLMNVFQMGSSGVTGSSGASRTSASSKSGKSQKSTRKSSGGGSSTSAAARGAFTTPIVAVADPRTYSVIVTASKDDMPDIAEVIAQLDSSSERKQKVFVYTLENADVRQVENVLRGLFQTSNARSSTSNQPDPLATRAATNTQTAGSNISLGNTRR
ncbi:MAG: secretin N-terminal domain-containing protein [Opitutaceae bacterium]|nr:secretin N-terminal domain-containing protein [Opitutaceae bacterium]